MKVRALVVAEKDAPFETQEVDLAAPGRDEVLVRIVASGVCHTDAITRGGDMPMPFPSVLGHEGSGIVEAVGDGVTQVAVGDRVIIGCRGAGSARTASTVNPGTACAPVKRWSRDAGSRVSCGARPPTPATGRS
jgi:aryl-alcohol dehydrogenase